MLPTSSLNLSNPLKRRSQSCQTTFQPYKNGIDINNFMKMVKPIKKTNEVKSIKKSNLTIINISTETI